MTQDQGLRPEEIIRMAREAGFDIEEGLFPFEAAEDKYIGTERTLERFAALVAANEREACAKESLEVLDNLRKEAIAQCQQGMIEAYKLGQSEEREACAKACDEVEMRFGRDGDALEQYGANQCAAAIRARGE